jgi:hypothetical protein
MSIILQMDIRFGYSKKQSGSFIAGLLAAYSGSDASGVSLDFQKLPTLTGRLSTAD